MSHDGVHPTSHPHLFNQDRIDRLWAIIVTSPAGQEYVPCWVDTDQTGVFPMMTSDPAQVSALRAMVTADPEMRAALAGLRVALAQFGQRSDILLQAGPPAPGVHSS